ncbi:hypothetical protein B0H19DRAFT_1337408 [Mycena capillaripes]|nr:hypothetical protein B0H19DRAFT_1337408 [Mycena capillaripes]
MQRTLFTLKPSSACSFRVQALQYIPENSFEDGFSLIFLHAVNLHKETFEVMLLHLLKSKQTANVRIKDIWCIGEWWFETAAEYTRAVHAFLTSRSHGIDFGKRTLVGLAHLSQKLFLEDKSV